MNVHCFKADNEEFLQSNAFGHLQTAAHLQKVL